MGGSAAVITDVAAPAAVDATAAAATDAAATDAAATAADAVGPSDVASPLTDSSGNPLPSSDTMGPSQTTSPLTDSNGNPLPSTPSTSSTSLPSSVQNALTGKAISTGLNALLGSGSSGTTGTTGTSGTTGSTGTGSGSTSSGLSSLSTPDIPNLTPGLTKQESSQINPFGATFASPTMINDYMARGGSVGHYDDGGEVSITPPMPNQNYKPQLVHGRSVVSLAPHNTNGLVAMPHFADGGHVPEFYSEGGLKNRYVKGAGDGTSDDVPAMLANGEFVIPADVVSGLGNGSNDSGAKVLDEFLQTVRAHKQMHDAKNLPPDSKGALAYLAEAHKKVRA